MCQDYWGVEASFEGVIDQVVTCKVVGSIDWLNLFFFLTFLLRIGDQRFLTVKNMNKIVSFLAHLLADPVAMLSVVTPSFYGLHFVVQFFMDHVSDRETNTLVWRKILVGAYSRYISFLNLYTGTSRVNPWATARDGKEPSVRGHPLIITAQASRDEWDTNNIGRALIKASSEGRVEMVKLLLARDGIPKDKLGRALIEASGCGHVEVVKLLLAQRSWTTEETARAPLVVAGGAPGDAVEAAATKARRNERRRLKMKRRKEKKDTGDALMAMAGGAPGPAPDGQVVAADDQVQDIPGPPPGEVVAADDTPGPAPGEAAGVQGDAGVLPHGLSLQSLEEMVTCPISCERMTDPVVASDGHSYDKKSIDVWIESVRDKGHTLTSPMTNNPWDGDYFPSHSLRQIVEWLRTHS